MQGFGRQKSVECRTFSVSTTFLRYVKIQYELWIVEVLLVFLQLQSIAKIG